MALEVANASVGTAAHAQGSAIQSLLVCWRTDLIWHADQADDSLTPKCINQWKRKL
jgi:hypothetical protein